MSSTLETLEQQEKRLLKSCRRLKLEGRLLLIVRRQNRRNKNERMKLDVKFYWVLTCSRKWKMKQRNKKILAEINEYLTEDRDRKLFNLP